MIPAVEGLIFLVLLAWAQFEYESRRKDGPAYRQHLADLQGFARYARGAGFFVTIRRGGEFQAIRQIDMSGPRARNFRSHYSEVAHHLDEWNAIADGLEDLGNRFQGLTHRESEAATDGHITTAFPMLLSALGRGDIRLGDVSWRIDQGQLEASWQSDVFGAPAFSQIVRSDDLTAKSVEGVGATVSVFPEQPDVREYRRRLEEAARLRPILLNGLEHAEIVTDLQGKCEHCPP